MRKDRRAVLLTLPVALTVLVGCTASAPTETAPPKFDQSINEVRDTSIEVVDSMVEAFPGARRLADSAPNVYPCPGEDPGIGRWVWALSIANLDIDGTIAALQDRFGDAVTSTGTSSQEVEYSDGTTWSVSGAHTLIEDETGSYLMSYPPGKGGTVTLRVVTSCGVLD